MDKISLIEFGELKAIVLGVSSRLEDDSLYKREDAAKELNKAILMLHDMETNCIRAMNIGSLSAGA